MQYHLNLDNCSLTKGYPGINAKTYIDNLYDKNKITINYQK